MLKPFIRIGSITQQLIVFNICVAAIYSLWWMNPDHVGHPTLYGLLAGGEVYHLIMACTFWMSVWPLTKQKLHHTPSLRTHPPVDIYIPVASEPLEIIRATALAAKTISYPNHTVYILNDGYVINHPGWQKVEALAQEIGVHCITRTQKGGAKAGNINNALKKTTGEYIAIFDADMVAHPDFLEKTLRYFHHESVGFVQSPQYYNNAKKSYVASAAWGQQEFFFGPIMMGKDGYNSSFICGTNFVIRRRALEEVGGMNEHSIAEDFLTSLYVHQKGWKSVYVPEVLAEGLAPEDLSSYYKQQLRWARGSLDLLVFHNPLFKRNLSIKQKIQYLSSALYYCNGFVVLIDILLPLFFLYLGIEAVTSTTTSFALFFLPFIFFSLYLLYQVSAGSLTFRAISFSYSSWALQLQALLGTLLGIKTKFAVTPKQAQQGNFLFIVWPHILYTVALLVGIGLAISREGFTPSVATNSAWGLFNVTMFIPFIKAAYPWERLFSGTSTSEPLQSGTLLLSSDS